MKKVMSLFLVVIQLFMYMFFPNIRMDVVDNRTAIKLKFGIELSEDVQIDYYKRTIAQDTVERTYVKLTLTQEQWDDVYKQMLQQKYNKLDATMSADETACAYLAERFDVSVDDISSIYLSHTARYEYMWWITQSDRYIYTSDCENGNYTLYMIVCN